MENKTVTRVEVHVMLNEFANASSHVGKRVIVIGAWVSGLSATNALADHFEEVVVLERDELPTGATPRLGPLLWAGSSSFSTGRSAATSWHGEEPKAGAPG
jgi:glycine/D-amino acid oxidase-like deaminating enzyme